MTQKRKIGRYEIQSRIGSGAMGSVFKAIDPVIKRVVAIKKVRLDLVTDPEEKKDYKRRFFTEAEISGKFLHPNIVVLHDVGEENGVPFIAMEYVQGKTLRELIDANLNLNAKILTNIFNQLATALDYAHERGIIHRDLKPQNIMITKREQVKILDFGIAKISDTHITKTGVFLGTPSYSSPEQVTSSSVDYRSDIFSFGVLAYEVLTRASPFATHSVNKTLYNIAYNPPDLLALLRSHPQLADRLRPVFEKVMQKDPNLRYQKASEFANELARALLDADVQPVDKKVDEASRTVSVKWDAIQKPVAASTPDASTELPDHAKSHQSPQLPTAPGVPEPTLKLGFNPIEPDDGPHQEPDSQHKAVGPPGGDSDEMPAAERQEDEKAQFVDHSVLNQRFDPAQEKVGNHGTSTTAKKSPDVEDQLEDKRAIEPISLSGGSFESLEIEYHRPVSQQPGSIPQQSNEKNQLAIWSSLAAVIVAAALLFLLTIKMRNDSEQTQDPEQHQFIQEKTNDVVRESATAAGMLYLHSEPEGAVVLLNGYEIGITPCAVEAVLDPNADYEIAAWLSGFEPQTYALSVDDLDSCDIDFTFDEVGVAEFSSSLEIDSGSLANIGNSSADANPVIEESELKKWQWARRINRIYAYREFQKQYPDSTLAEEARTEIEKIESWVLQHEQAEPNVWEGAEKTDDVNAYRSYIAAYPKGTYVDQAKLRIKELDDYANSHASSDLDDLVLFSKNHPQSDFLSGIEKRAFSLVSDANQQDLLLTYLNGFMGYDAKHTDDVQKRLQAIRDSNLKKLVGKLRHNPLKKKST